MATHPARTRDVTLVVREAGALAALAPLRLETPWWPDVAPIGAAYPGLAVLRLLDAVPEAGAVMGGHVTYLGEWLPRHLGGASPCAAIAPYEGTLASDPLRQPWAEEGAPARDLDWVDGELGLAAPPIQERTWNLSAIWRLATERGEAWLKCLPSFSRHEPAVLAALEGPRVPRLLGVDGHRELLAPMPGRDGYAATLEEHLVLLEVLVELQLGTVGRTEALGAVGVPDRRPAALADLAAPVVDRHLPDDEDLAWLLATAPQRTAAIEACGLPDVLVHGDAHPGNARVGEGTGPGLWFDWADARVGHPMVDLAVLERPRTAHREVLRARWLDLWRRHLPESDPRAAWELLRPLAAIGDAVVYQGFLDGIEASERIYHRDDVLPCLRLAARLAAEERRARRYIW